MSRQVTALGLALLIAAGCVREPEPPRGVVLVLLDTLRPDHLGCYGYDARPTSPRIDRIAERATVFDTAISHAPWTLAAMVSILSGFPDDRHFDGELRRSLVEDLTAAGIRTAAFTEGGYFTDAFGLGLGFDEFHEEHYLFDGGIERTFETAFAWLAEHRDERFFLLVHTYEAHMPYLRETFCGDLDPGNIGRHFTEETHQSLANGELRLTPDELDYLEALYDGGVHECDRWVGRLVDELETLGLGEETVVILTSDHGEELTEGRFPAHAGDHGHALFDYLLRVPLIVADPRASRSGIRRVSSQVRSMDVLPTVLELLGVNRPADIEGRSLVPLMRGEESTERPARGGNPEVGPPRDFVRRDGVKLIRLREEVEPDSPFAHLPELRLYDLASDPTEESNLAPEREALVHALLEQLERELAGTGIDPDVLELTPELEAQLRALGYGD